MVRGGRLRLETLGACLFGALASFGTTGCGGKSDRTNEHVTPGGAAGNDAGPTIPDGTCACPEKAEGTWIADATCVYGPDGGWCAPRLDIELGGLVGAFGGVWSRGCGGSTVVSSVGDAPAVACVYDANGAFVGASRSMPSECPGVATVATAPGLDCSDVTSCWIGPNGDGSLPHCADASSVLPQACVDYDASNIADAFMSVGNAAATLDGYVASILEQNGADRFTVAVGCGLTSLFTYGFGSSLVTFDASGALVGFAVNGDAPYGPCRASGYRRGTVPPGGCDGYHVCRLPPDAQKTGVVCDCPCPESPPESGVVETTFECVNPTYVNPCSETKDEELGMLASFGGWRTTGCDYVTTTRLVTSPLRPQKDELDCLYDPSGKLVHAERVDAAPSGCPGVTTWTTGTPPLVECPPARCWYGPVSAPDGTPQCTD